jgi:hypothetical protein
MEKAHSLNKRYWEKDRNVFFDVLLLDAEEPDCLIGTVYYEGGCVPANAEDMVNTGKIIDCIRKGARNAIGEIRRVLACFSRKREGGIQKTDNIVY